MYTRLAVARVVCPTTISLSSPTAFILIPDIDKERNRRGKMHVGGNRPVQQR